MQDINTILDRSITPRQLDAFDVVIPAFLDSPSKARQFEVPDDEQPESVDLPKALRSKGRGKLSGIEFARQKAEEAKLRKQSNIVESVTLQEVLPFWSDSKRGVPNPLIRSGLFSVRTSVKRNLIDERVASLSNYQVNYKGMELRQDDLSVWMALIHKARKQHIDDPIFFRGGELCRDLGWRVHSESYTRIKECIERLKFTSLKIATTDDKGGYVGSLIRDFAYDALDDKGNIRWMARLESTIAKMFQNDSTTFLEWEQRKLIGPRDVLTLWLHTFFASHYNPIPISIGKLHELCKSQQKVKGNFKIRVRASLEKLVKIQFLKSYSIDIEMVSLQRLHPTKPALPLAAMLQLK
jgi:hypothetical protein